MSTQSVLPFIQWPRRRPFLPFVLLGSVTLCLLTFFWLATRLSANPNQPDGLGSLAGQVRVENGQPIAGIQVTLLGIPTFAGYDTWWNIRMTTTEADGSYRFSSLPPGVYRISAQDPSKQFGRRFYPAANTVQAGQDVVVAGTAVTGINLTLQAAGRIIVTLKTTAEYSLTYASVGLRQRISTTGGTRWDAPYTPDVVLGSTVFTFTGVAADAYRVCAYGYGPKLSASECYDNVYDVAEATDLTLSAGGTITNVVIVFGDGANYAQIKGRVTATADGKPLAGIHVFAYRLPENWLVRVATADGWRGIASTTEPGAPLLAANEFYGYPQAVTDANGEYTLSTLTAGQYQLYFSDPAGNYAFEYYNDQVRLYDGQMIEVEPQMVITAVNSSLATAARINGRITMDGQPAPETNILAERQIGEFAWEPVMQVRANPNTGAYTLAGLPAGVYRVSAQGQVLDNTASDYSLYFPYGVYGGATLWEAKAITLTSGAVATNIDIALSSLRYDGGLSGRITAGGQPLAGIKVALYSATSGCCAYGIPVPRLYTFTDAAGRYIFTGLGGGRFFLGASDPTGLYATTYYINQINPLRSNTVNIPNDQVLTDYNLDLTRAGAIHGQVRQRNGKPEAGLYLSLYRMDPAPDYDIIPTASYTDDAGRYTLPGLQPGWYTICFSKFNYQFRTECTMQSVLVNAGATTANVDLMWGPDLPFYLPLIRQ